MRPLHIVPFVWNEVQSDWDVLVLPAERFQPPPPAPGFELVRRIDRELERELLKSEFERWQIPFEREFRGARPDSLFALAEQGGEVAMIAYLADDNQLGLTGYGELLYAVSNPAFRGRGLYKPFVWRMFDLGRREWGIDGVVLVPNREGLDQVYLRWQAIPVGKLRRVGRARHALSGLIHPQRPLRRKARRLISDAG